MIEKREYWRKDISLNVKYAIPRAGIAGEAKSDNITETGIHLSVNEKVEIGAILELDIEIPRSALPISVLAEVIWVKAITIAGDGKKDDDFKAKVEYYEAGLKFARIDASDRGKILKHIYGLSLPGENGDIEGEPGKGIKQVTAAEKRQYVRLTTQVHVRYKVPGMIEGEAETIDISGTGMRLVLDTKLERGVIELEIDLPDQDKPIFTLGKVIWCKLSGAKVKGQFEIGVQFAGMKDVDKERIIKYVHSEHKKTP